MSVMISSDFVWFYSDISLVHDVASYCSFNGSPVFSVAECGWRV